uniref:Female-specific orf protein n=1 Tax=Lampsilis siliquoidea TaxID=52396 RepID=F4ZFG1_LAMSI|nr:female-specific orf protein [Lampsilis siliquoidea]UZC55554.1 female open reading frame [Lampsilis siliquoidea]UZC55610.1 female open reading frame [Lampsilis siliquoidea]
MVIKMKTRIMNMFQHKVVQKLIIVFTTGLLLMTLLSNPFLMVMTKVSYTELSLTDNPLEKNQPISTPATSTGSYPIKNSPASTNISDKT